MNRLDQVLSPSTRRPRRQHCFVPFSWNDQSLGAQKSVKSEVEWNSNQSGLYYPWMVALSFTREIQRKWSLLEASRWTHKQK
mmetsp:Transcript_1114/g.2348  ORF Transcript_1114/g.2348 Transcript_1114/m.2348 type:complete len:82 (+) Transcript_1114:481-726(+)